jgi:nicotinamidase-related amidase
MPTTSDNDSSRSREVLAAIDVRRTALLLVDMQQDYADPKGYFGSRGIDVSPVRAIIPRLANVLNACRDAGMRVFHTQFSLISGFPDVPDLHRVVGRHFPGIQPTRLVRGTKGVQFVPELAPLPSEPVIQKPTILSAFIGTELEVLLRRIGVSSLIIGGTATHACVLHTCYDAFARDFDVLLLEDGVATFYNKLQEPVLELVDILLGATTSTAAVVEWIKASHQAGDFGGALTHV